MARYQVILAYDGTQFYGFQRQAASIDERKNRTVQQVVEAALQRIGWQGRTILAAGRTDTGVHASGQVIAFDLEWKHSLQELQAALNANMPFDVAAQAVSEVPSDFHPRYSAIARRYQYKIFCQAVRDPLGERYAWRVWPAVDMDRLRLAASYLPGTHDFVAFGTPPRSGGSTIRRVTQAAWWKESTQILSWPDPEKQAPICERTALVFEIVGNSFLYHMVRRLVSLQVAIGQGELEPEGMLQFLSGGEQKIVHGLAPPHGLTLAEVIYPPWPAAKRQEGVRQEGENKL